MWTGVDAVLVRSTWTPGQSQLSGLYFLFLVTVSVLGFEPRIQKRSHVQQGISGGILVLLSEVVEVSCLHC